MSAALTPLARFALAHTWNTPSDLAALRYCAEFLHGRSVAFTDAGDGPADAAKMHGMALLEAHARQDALCDLREAAHEGKWSARLPVFVRRYMTRGDAWFGIPVGVHQSNWMWLNETLARSLDRAPPRQAEEIGDWLANARRAVAAPLAVGREPWQLGIVFESMVLAHGGATGYRAVFEDLDSDAWHEPPLVAAVARFLALREFVDESALDLDWRGQLERLRAGSAAMMFMGDWVRRGAQGLWGSRFPGTSDVAVTVLDCFVPLARADRRVCSTVALALTEPVFQRQFAHIKGCTPPVSDWEPAWGRTVPSLTFEQSCPQQVRTQLLEIAAEHFLCKRPVRECIAALAEASGPRSSKGACKP